jgi:biotin carboxylase
MARILLLMSTRTYKAEALLAAAARRRLDVVVGSNQVQALSHLNPDGNLALPFDAPEAAVRRVLRFASAHRVDAVVAADDDGAPLAAAVGEALGVAHNPVDSVRVTTDKLATRRALRAAGLRAPRFWSAARAEPARDVASRVEYPCVLKPRHLSGSRGVMRVDDEEAFLRAHARLAAILDELGAPRRPERDSPGHDILVERFVPGDEVALEGLLERGVFRPLAFFDKPDPLDGPFFEETIYVTPSRHAPQVQNEVIETTRAAVKAFGLRHGAVHAELRVNAEGAWLLEAAPRSIGGLCSRALAFGDGSVSLEEVLVRNALGENTEHCRRERRASGVMMIPIRRAGILRSVAGVEAARAVPGVSDIRITVAPGQAVSPPPEGARYLGFIFARGDAPVEVERALRASHARLHIQIERTDGRERSVLPPGAAAIPDRGACGAMDARETG